jgi:hypothetical protein
MGKVPSLVIRLTRTRTHAGGKIREGQECIVCNGLTTVRPHNEVTLSPCACTECWGCGLQHGMKTVRPLDCAAFFPCYSIAAARNLLSTDVCHTVARSAVTNLSPDSRVVIGNVVLL